VKVNHTIELCLKGFDFLYLRQSAAITQRQCIEESDQCSQSFLEVLFRGMVTWIVNRFVQTKIKWLGFFTNIKQWIPFNLMSIQYTLEVIHTFAHV
jgi:hypothetical protein